MGGMIIAVHYPRADVIGRAECCQRTPIRSPIASRSCTGTRGAYFGRIGLSAAGFYATPDLGYDFDTNSGKAFNYFCFGGAVAEVEIDTLTGDHMLRHADLVMDVGSSLNRPRP